MTTLRLVLDAQTPNASRKRVLSEFASLQFVSDGAGGIYATLTLAPADVRAMTGIPSHVQGRMPFNTRLRDFLRTPLVAGVIARTPPNLASAAALHAYDHNNVTSRDYAFTRTDQAIADGMGVITPPTCFFMAFPDVEPLTTSGVPPVQYGALMSGAPGPSTPAFVGLGSPGSPGPSFSSPPGTPGRLRMRRTPSPPSFQGSLHTPQGVVRTPQPESTRVAMAELERRLREAQDAQEQAVLDLSVAEQELAEARRMGKSVDDGRQAVIQKLDMAQEELDRLRESHRRLELENQALGANANTAQQLEQERARLAAQLQQATQDAQQAQQQLQRMTVEAQQAQLDRNAVEAARLSANSQLGALRGEVAAERRRADDVAAQLAQSEDSRRIAEDERKKLQDDLARLRASATTHTHTAEVIERESAEIASLRSDMHDAVATIGAMRNDLAALIARRESGASDAQLASVERQIATITTSMQELTGLVGDTRNRHNQLVNESRSLHALLAAHHTEVIAKIGELHRQESRTMPDVHEVRAELEKMRAENATTFGKIAGIERMLAGMPRVTISGPDGSMTMPALMTPLPAGRGRGQRLPMGRPAQSAPPASPGFSPSPIPKEPRVQKARKANPFAPTPIVRKDPFALDAPILSPQQPSPPRLSPPRVASPSTESEEAESSDESGTASDTEDESSVYNSESDDDGDVEQRKGETPEPSPPPTPERPAEKGEPPAPVEEPVQEEAPAPVEEPAPRDDEESDDEGLEPTLVDTPPRTPPRSPVAQPGPSALVVAELEKLELGGKGTAHSFPSNDFMDAFLEARNNRTTDATRRCGYKRFLSTADDATRAEIAWRYVMTRVAGHFWKWYPRQAPVNTLDAKADDLVVRLERGGFGAYATAFVRTARAAGSTARSVLLSMARFADEAFREDAVQNTLMAAFLAVVLAGMSAGDVSDFNLYIATPYSIGSRARVVRIPFARTTGLEVNANQAVECQRLVVRLRDFLAKSIAYMEQQLAVAEMVRVDPLITGSEGRDVLARGPGVETMDDYAGEHSRVAFIDGSRAEYRPALGVAGVKRMRGEAIRSTRVGVWNRVQRVTVNESGKWFGATETGLKRDDLDVGATAQFIQGALHTTMNNSSCDVYSELRSMTDEVAPQANAALLERTLTLLGRARPSHWSGARTFMQFVAIVLSNAQDVTVVQGAEITLLEDDDEPTPGDILQFLRVAEAHRVDADQVPPAKFYNRVPMMLTVFEGLYLAYAFYRMSREPLGAAPRQDRTATHAREYYKELVKRMRAFKELHGEQVRLGDYAKFEKTTLECTKRAAADPAFGGVLRRHATSPVDAALALLLATDRNEGSAGEGGPDDATDADWGDMSLREMLTTPAQAPLVAEAETASLAELTPVTQLEEGEVLETVVATVLPPETAPDAARVEDDAVTILDVTSDDTPVMHAVERAVDAQPDDPPAPAATTTIVLLDDDEPLPTDPLLAQFRDICGKWDAFMEMLNVALPGLIQDGITKRAAAEQDARGMNVVANQQGDAVGTHRGLKYSGRQFLRVLENYLQWAMTGREVELKGFRPRGIERGEGPVFPMPGDNNAPDQPLQFVWVLTGRTVLSRAEGRTMRALQDAERYVPSPENNPDKDMETRFALFEKVFTESNLDVEGALMDAAICVEKLARGLDLIRFTMLLSREWYSLPMGDRQERFDQPPLYDYWQDRIYRVLYQLRDDADAPTRKIEVYALVVDKLMTTFHEELRFMSASPHVGQIVAASDPTLQEEDTSVEEDPTLPQKDFVSLPNLKGPAFMRSLVPDPNAPPHELFTQWERLVQHWSIGLLNLDSAYRDAIEFFIALDVAQKARTRVAALFKVAPFVTDTWDEVPVNVRAIYADRPGAPANELAATLVDELFLLSLRYYTGEPMPDALAGYGLQKSTYFLNTLVEERDVPETSSNVFGKLHLARADRTVVTMNFLLVDMAAIENRVQTYAMHARALVVTKLYREYVATRVEGYRDTVYTADGFTHLADAMADKPLGEGEDPEESMADRFATYVEARESWIPAVWFSVLDLLARFETAPASQPEPRLSMERILEARVRDPAALAVISEGEAAAAWVKAIPRRELEEIMDNPRARGPVFDQKELASVSAAEAYAQPLALNLSQLYAKSRDPPDVKDELVATLEYLVRHLYATVKGTIPATTPPTESAIMVAWRGAATKANQNKAFGVQSPTTVAAVVYRFVLAAVAANIPATAVARSMEVFSTAFMRKLREVGPTINEPVDDPREEKRPVAPANERMRFYRNAPSAQQRRMQRWTRHVMSVAHLTRMLLHMNAVNADRLSLDEVLNAGGKVPVIPVQVQQKTVNALMALLGEGSMASGVKELQVLGLADKRVAEPFLYAPVVLRSMAPVDSLANLNEDSATWQAIADDADVVARNVMEAASADPRVHRFGPHPLVRLWRQNAVRKQFEDLARLKVSSGVQQQGCMLFILRMALTIRKTPRVNRIRNALIAWGFDTRLIRSEVSVTFEQDVLRGVNSASRRYYGWPEWLLAFRGLTQRGALADVFLLAANVTARELDPEVTTLPQEVRDLIAQLLRAEARYADKLLRAPQFAWQNLLRNKLVADTVMYPHVYMRVGMDYVRLARTGKPLSLPGQPLTEEDDDLALHLASAVTTTSGPLSSSETQEVAMVLMGQITRFHVDARPDKGFWPTKVTGPSRTLEDAVIAMSQRAVRLSSTRAAYAILDTMSLESQFARRVEASILGNATDQATYEQARARTNAFVWDMAVQLQTTGAGGFWVRLLNVVCGTDAAWSEAGPVHEKNIRRLAEILTGASGMDTLLRNHRIIARNIVAVKRCPEHELVALNLTARERAFLAQLNDLWHSTVSHMTRIMNVGALPLHSYTFAIDEVGWFLEGLITSMYLANVGDQAFLPRDKAWREQLGKMVDRIRDAQLPGSSSSAKAEAPVEQVSAPAEPEPETPDEEVHALVAAIMKPHARPTDRVPQMRAPGPRKTVSFASHVPQPLQQPQSQRRGNPVYSTKTAATDAPRVSFVQRDRNAGRW